VIFIKHKSASAARRDVDQRRWRGVLCARGNISIKRRFAVLACDMHAGWRRALGISARDGWRESAGISETSAAA